MHQNALLLTFSRPCKIAFYSNSHMQVAADIVLKLIETPASSLLLPHSTQEWLGVVRRLTPSPSPTKSHALLIPPIPPCKPSPALRLDPPCHWLASKSRSSKRNCFGSSHVPKWFGITVIINQSWFLIGERFHNNDDLSAANMFLFYSSSSSSAGTDNRPPMNVVLIHAILIGWLRHHWSANTPDD